MLKRFLHIIRWPNLALIALVQLIIFLKVIDSSASALKLPDFILLSLITMIIAAAGYVINDYYDHAIDRINKPKHWIAGNTWKLPGVLNLYKYLVALGAILSIWLAIRLDLLPFLAIYPVAVFALWLYSSALKCKPIIGNLWVSLFCSGVVIIVALPDWIADNHTAVNQHLMYYALFAFLATWFREIVKDIEDREGDRQAGCSTFAVRFGVRSSKVIALVVVAILVGTVYRWAGIQSNTGMEMALTVLQGGIVTSMAFVWWAKDKSYYRIASLLIKIIMLLGTVVLLLL